MPPLKAQLLLAESLAAYFPEMVFTDSGITVQIHRNTQRTEQNRARRLGRPQANRNARQEEGPAESATSLFHPCGRAGAFRRDMEEPAPGSQSALHTPARRNSPILDARSVVRSHEADSRSAGYAHRSPGRGPRKPVEAFSPARKGVAAAGGRVCLQGL